MQENTFKNRIEELNNLDMTPNIKYQSYMFEDVNIGFVEMKTLNDEEWNFLIEKIKPVLNNRKLIKIQKKDKNV